MNTQPINEDAQQRQISQKKEATRRIVWSEAVNRRQSEPYEEIVPFRRRANKKGQQKVLSYTLDDLSSLTVELVRIPGVGFLLAILEPSARVGFKHAVLGAVVAVAKGAVTNNALGGFLALLEVAARLTGSHVVWWRENVRGADGEG
jgi:hypothetical protein